MVPKRRVGDDVDPGSGVSWLPSSVITYSVPFPENPPGVEEQPRPAALAAPARWAPRRVAADPQRLRQRVAPAADALGRSSCWRRSSSRIRRDDRRRNRSIDPSSGVRRPARRAAEPLRIGPPRAAAPTEPAPPEPPPRLLSNGLGGFSGKARVRDHADGSQETPLPWVNVIANPSLRHHRPPNRVRRSRGGEQPREPADAVLDDPISDPAPKVLYIRGRRLRRGVDGDARVRWNGRRRADAGSSRTRPARRGFERTARRPRARTHHRRRSVRAGEAVGAEADQPRFVGAAAACSATANGCSARRKSNSAAARDHGARVDSGAMLVRSALTVTSQGVSPSAI